MEDFSASSPSPQTIAGVGVHTGQKVHVRLSAAPVGSGIRFIRTDLPNKPVISACLENIRTTDFATTIGLPDGTSVSTAEHLMAALWAENIADINVHIDGPEVPILDGSSAPWCRLLNQSQLPRQKRATKKKLHLSGPCKVYSQRGWLEAVPAEKFIATMIVPLENNLTQHFSFDPLKQSFATDIAPARTFSLAKHLEKMRAQGLIKGGSLENALVLENNVPVNSGGWRLKDECARHKILDLIGDWYFAGYDVCAHVTGYASGHSLNKALLDRIMNQQPKAKLTTHQHIRERQEKHLTLGT